MKSVIYAFGGLIVSAGFHLHCFCIKYTKMTPFLSERRFFCKRVTFVWGILMDSEYKKFDFW